MQLEVLLPRHLELTLRVVELIVLSEAEGEGALPILEQSSLVHGEAFVADFLLDPGQLGDEGLLCAGLEPLLVLLSVVGDGFLAGLSLFGNFLRAAFLVLGWRLSGVARESKLTFGVFG